VTPAPLGSEERRRLARLADTLIPARDGMPAASEMDVHGRGADRVCALRPDLVEPLRRALAADAPVADLRARDAEGFQAVAAVVSAAYLTEPRVHALLGYPGRPPIRTAEPDAEIAELRDLVRPVQERGSIWPATPAAERPD
jgi:hypothetical protein